VAIVPRIAPTIACMLLIMSACDSKPTAPAAAAPAEAPAPKKQVSSAELTPTIPPPAVIERMLAQRVLDHPKVAPYLHTENAANLPLRVAPSPDLAQGVARLQVAGQPVQVVAEAEARVVFKGREKIGPARERVRFEIPAEGVVGHVDLELADNVWTAVDASVAER
jgi:hypothetical protein